MSNRSDITRLMTACRDGNLPIVISEIDSGADVNSCNKNGTTPLMYAKTAAFGNGDLQIMKILIQAGARVEIKDNNGKNALEYAIDNSTKIIDFLKENHT